MVNNNIFISHASEDKGTVNPFVKCLQENGITNYWYDKEKIQTGDIFVKKINEGLSKSKIGVIIFSKNYLMKDWALWEFWVIMTLLITHKIRIIPFMSNDITYEKIVEDYPILMPIRFNPIPSCDRIVDIIRKKLNETSLLIQNPTLFSFSKVRIQIKFTF